MQAIKKQRLKEIPFFINYLADPRPNLGHYSENSVTHPILITTFIQVLTQRPPEASKRG